MNIVSKVTGDCHAALLHCMFILSMTAFRGDTKPAVLLNERDNVPDFHGRVHEHFSNLHRMSRMNNLRSETREVIGFRIGSHHHRMAIMKKRKPSRPRRKPTQNQIDRLVTSQADKDLAWEKAIVVRRPKFKALSLPAELAARATFVAKLYKESRVDKWIERIVRERLEIEESAFAAAKKRLTS
jgi:hypothetical protein